MASWGLRVVQAAVGGAARLLNVLIIDGDTTSSKLISQILRATGDYKVSWAPNHQEGWLLLDAPRIDVMFVELKPPRHDGLLFTRELRLSELPTRKSPVIMLATEPTETVIKAARDAGVNEFLRKPFKVRDLTVRVDAVTQTERRWIEGVHYVGPDRRRFNSAEYAGPRQRHHDKDRANSDEARIGEALKIMHSALGVIHSRPRQALRALRAQAEELETAAVRRADYPLAAAAQQLKGYLEAASSNGVLSRRELAAHASALRPAGINTAA